MQLKITLACAAALALPMAAHATAPTSYTDTAGAMVIYMAGSSSADNFLNGIAASMLQAGYYSYIDNDSSALPGNNYTAYLGYAASGSGLPITQKVLLIKRSRGGSAWGLFAVARSESIATLKVNSSCTLHSGRLYKCAPQGLDPAQPGYPTGSEMVPDFGLTDVPPSMFQAPLNTQFFQTQLTPAESLVLSTTQVHAVAMGVVATAAIPDSVCLSQAAYGSMLSGSIYDWSSLLPAAQYPSGGTQVVVCRRVPGSGTQASYNWMYNKFPCDIGTPERMTGSAGYPNPIPPGQGSSTANAIGIDVTQGYTVIESQTSGDVRRCLKAANNGGVYSFQDENNLWHQVDFGAGGYGAIGDLSLDSQEKTADGAESAWFFHPIDGMGFFHYATQTCTSGAGTGTGVCPSHQNLLQDKYPFLVESTMQYRSGANPVDPAKKPFIDEFIKRAGADAYQKNWTVVLPLDSNGQIPVFNAARDVINNVARGTHDGNMCKQLILKY